MMIMNSKTHTIRVPLILILERLGISQKYGIIEIDQNLNTEGIKIRAYGDAYGFTTELKIEVTEVTLSEGENLGIIKP